MADLALFQEADFATDPAPFIAQLDSIQDIDAYQAQISSHLDSIDTQLMHQISLHSPTFFQALSLTQELQDSLSGISEGTGQVKQQVQEYRDRLRGHYEELKGMYWEMRNLQRVMEQVEQLEAIFKMKKQVQSLVDLCSFDEALLLIHKLEAMIVAVQAGLEEVEPLKSLKADLVEMKVALEKMKHSDISSEDLRT